MVAVFIFNQDLMENYRRKCNPSGASDWYFYSSVASTLGKEPDYDTIRNDSHASKP